MTREEVLEITLQVIKGKMWWAVTQDTIIEIALAAAEYEREAFLTDELLKLLEQIYWTMKDDMPVALRSECFDVLDRCGVKV